MRRLICFLAACLLSACTSTQSDIPQEIADNPPSTAAPGKVAIWVSPGERATAIGVEWHTRAVLLAMHLGGASS